MFPDVGTLTAHRPRRRGKARGHWSVLEDAPCRLRHVLVGDEHQPVAGVGVPECARDCRLQVIEVRYYHGVLVVAC